MTSIAKRPQTGLSTPEQQKTLPAGLGTRPGMAVLGNALSESPPALGISRW